MSPSLQSTSENEKSASFTYFARTAFQTLCVVVLTFVLYHVFDITKGTDNCSWLDQTSRPPSERAERSTMLQGAPHFANKQCSFLEICTVFWIITPPLLLIRCLEWNMWNMKQMCKGLIPLQLRLPYSSVALASGLQTGCARKRDVWNNHLDSPSDILRQVNSIWLNVVKCTQGFKGQLDSSWSSVLPRIFAWDPLGRGSSVCGWTFTDTVSLVF